MSKKMSHYEVLGVPVDATEADIKLAYRRLAMACHPDRQTNEEDRVSSAEVFKRVQGAYDVLSDPEKRANYDRYGEGNLDIREDIKKTVLAEFNSLVQMPEGVAWIIDMFDTMRKSLNAKIAANKVQMKTAEKDIERMSKLSKRIGVKGGGVHNVFMDLINQRTETAREFIRGADLANLVLSGAVGYLDNFEDYGNQEDINSALDNLFSGTVPNQFRLR